MQKEADMRTTLHIPEDLLKEAMKASHITTKTKVIIAALEGLIRKSKISDLKNFRGKVDLDIDMDAVRGRKCRISRHLNMGRVFQERDNCKIDLFIDEDLIVVNDLILAEPIPFLKVRNRNEIIRRLMNIDMLKLSIDWDEIIECQASCLKSGLNGIGIPDLIVAQNAKQNQCEIYSLDRHFTMMKNVLGLEVVSILTTCFNSFIMLQL